eukprot:95145-Karenia_brevis.AAC.1
MADVDRRCYADGEVKDDADNFQQLRAGDKVLAGALGHLTEIAQGDVTHFDSATKSYSRISRMFVGTSGWLLKQFCVKSHAQCDPLKLHRQRISDHCP